MTIWAPTGAEIWRFIASWPLLRGASAISAPENDCVTRNQLRSKLLIPSEVE